LRQLAVRLHRCGPRATHEALLTIACAIGPAEVLRLLAGFERLDPAMVRGVLDHYASGRQFPPIAKAVPR
jgi:hypothetical protein